MPCQTLHLRSKVKALYIQFSMSLTTKTLSKQQDTFLETFYSPLVALYASEYLLRVNGGLIKNLKTL